MHEEASSVKKRNVLEMIDDIVNKMVDSNNKENESQGENKKELDVMVNTNITNKNEKNSAEAEKEVTNVLLRRNVRTLAAERTLHRLREENDELKHHLVTSAHREHDLQRTIAWLQSTLQTMGKTVASQTATMRTLSQEMQRRDPYHLIKERHHTTSLIKEQEEKAALHSQEASEETHTGKNCNKRYHSSNKLLEKHNAESELEETNKNLRSSQEPSRSKHSRLKEILSTVQGEQRHTDEECQQKHKEEQELTSRSDNFANDAVNSKEEDDKKWLSNRSQSDTYKATDELKLILSSLTRCICQAINSSKLPYVFANAADMRGNVMTSNVRENVFLVEIQPTFCSGWDNTECEEEGRENSFILTVADAFNDVILTTSEHAFDESSKTIFFDSVSTHSNSDVRFKTHLDRKDMKFIDAKKPVNNANEEKDNYVNRVANKKGSGENEVENYGDNVIVNDNKSKCELLTLANTSSVLTIQLWQVDIRANSNELKGHFHNTNHAEIMEERGAVCVATGQLPLSMLLATAQLAKQTRYRNCTSPFLPLVHSSSCSKELRERQSQQHKEEEEYLYENPPLSKRHTMISNVVHTIQLYNPITKVSTPKTHQNLETVCSVSFNVTVDMIAPHLFTMTHCNRLKPLDHNNNNSHAQVNRTTRQESSSLQSVKTLHSRELVLEQQRHPTTRSELLTHKTEERHEPLCNNESSRTVSVSTPKNNSNTVNMAEIANSSDAEIEEVTELEKTPLLKPVQVSPSEEIPQDEQTQHKFANSFAASTRSLYICVKSAHNLIENATELLDVLGRCHPRVLIWVDEQLVYTIPTPTLDKKPHFYNDDKNDRSVSTNEEQGVSVEWDEDVAGFTTMVQPDSTLYFEVQDVNSTGVDPMGTASVAVREIAEKPLQMTLPVMLNGKKHGSLLIEFNV